MMPVLSNVAFDRYHPRCEPQTKIKKWDVCAGDAILQAAGGTLSDWKGNPVSYGYDSDEVLTAGLLVTGSDEAHTTLLKRLADEKTDQD